MEFAVLIRNAREKKYPSPRQFHQRAELPCSYFYYTKVEKGEAYPKVDLALAIIKALDINLRRGLHAWVREQMPTPETKAMFFNIEDMPERSTEQMSVDRSLVINRMHAKFLASDPVYWEILLYISCHFDVTTFTVDELAERLQFKLPRMKRYLTELYDYGLIDRDEREHYSSKEWLYIPQTTEFRELREVNFDRAYEKFRGARCEPKFRTTITRLVTEEQRKEIESYVEALQNWLIDMPDKDPPESRPYTIGLFASPRSFGNAES